MAAPVPYLQSQQRSNTYNTSMTLSPAALTPDNLRHAQDQTDPHDRAPESDTRIRGPRLPRPAPREIDEAQGRQDVRERAGGGGADELEDDADVAGEEGDGHGADDEGGGEDDVAVGLVGFGWEVVFGHYLAADETLEGEGGEHV